MATANSPLPRWKQLIAQGIKDGMAQKIKGTLYYTLATVEVKPSSSQSPTPHARMVVHRGFVNEQRSEKSDSGVEPFNDHFGSNACLLTTTDIRAPKAQQILVQASTGAGAARGEICWWMEHSMLQFRIAGSLHLLPHSDHSAAHAFSLDALSPVRNPEAKATSSEATEPFDWAKERRRIFEKLSPDLLASFTRPRPSARHPKATELSNLPGPGEGDPEAEKDATNSPWALKLPQPGNEETEEQKELLQAADRNFALVVLSPDRVDVVDLARDRRSLFTLADPSKGPNSEWNEERLVP